MLRRSMLIVVLLAVSAGMAAACSSDNSTKPASGSSTASQASVDEVSARIQRNEMLFAAFGLAALPLHDMDVAITSGKAGSTDVPNARAAVRLLALTSWDSSLRVEAEALHGHAADLLKALDEGDIDKAKDPAHQLHEGWHDFSDKLWAVLAKDLPADAGGVAGHDENSTTPTAATTAAAH